MGASSVAPLLDCKNTRGSPALGRDSHFKHRSAKDLYVRSRSGVDRSWRGQKATWRPKPSLYFKNLCSSIDETCLRKHFEVFGKIERICPYTNEEGLRRGDGKIFYSSLEEVEAAVTGMNGRILGSKPLSVHMSLTDRKSRLDRHHAEQNAAWRPHTPAGLGVCVTH